MKGDGEELRRSIRLRPAMYIGGMDSRGLYFLLDPLLLLGFIGDGCVRDVAVELRPDGSCRVSYSGWPWSGPVGRKALEDLAGWFTFDSYDWKARPSAGVPLGILLQSPYVDLGLVNALCSSLEVVAWGGGWTGGCRFREGLREMGRSSDSGVESSSTSTSGLCVTLTPDPALFNPPRRVPAQQLVARMRSLSAMKTGVGWSLRDEVSGVETRFLRTRGLADLCDELAENTGCLPEPWSFEGQMGSTRVRLALQWSRFRGAGIHSWANLHPALLGGVHHQGFHLGLRKVLRARLKARAPQHPALIPPDEELEKHLTAVLDLQVPEAVWHGPTRSQLGNPEVKSEVAWLVARWLEKAFAADSAMEAQVLSELCLPMKPVDPE
ncbi:hypothetical protein MFUL124B02_40950 [Myxococcus fulvus 124B02]|nr:hypothetical protein MFUL124B02_40950 [Myxococcus fulvus 124B02]